MRNGGKSTVGSRFSRPCCRLAEGALTSADSNILHIQGAGLNVVVLNSQEAAVELMDKRSAIYSSRYLILDALRSEQHC
jgi:hypothetical protein